jgi:predicted ArsR family transcriptional regulator
LNQTTRDLVALMARPNSNKVVEYLLRQPANRRATIDDIHRATGVAPASLSPLLNYLRARRLVDYRVSRSGPGRPLRHWRVTGRSRIKAFEKAASKL